MSTKQVPPEAAVYLRISLDKTGEDLAIERQREDCAELLQAKGWKQYGEEYVDRVSAYRRGGRRPGYDALLAEVEAGRVSRVVAYDLDRLTRQPRQLEQWIDLAEDRGIVVVTANGEADLGTDGGRLFARVKAAVAAGEIERKGKRQRDAYAQSRAKGLPPKGPRAYGFEPNRLTPREAEAKHIREAYRLLLSDASGEGTVYAARKYFAAQGIKTVHGNDWSQPTVRQLLARPSNAGLMKGNDGALMVGEIVPIVSRETWDAAQKVLGTPGRTVPAGRKPVKYWLAGVARCGACGSPMKAAAAKGTDYYRCKTATEPRADMSIRHVAIRAEDLHAIVLAEIFAAVAAGRFDGEEGASERIAELQASIASNRERQAQAQAAVLAGEGDPAVWRAGLAKLSREVEVLEEERDRLLARGGSVAPIAEKFRRLASATTKPHAVVKGWPEAFGGKVTPEERRTLARALGRITVKPGRRQPLERVEILHHVDEQNVA